MLMLRIFRPKRSKNKDGLTLDMEIEKYTRKLKIYLRTWEEMIPNSMIFLDNEILDSVTFEFIREATKEEIYYFYQIRSCELKLKELKNKL